MRPTKLASSKRPATAQSPPLRKGAGDSPRCTNAGRAGPELIPLQGARLAFRPPQHQGKSHEGGGDRAHDDGRFGAHALSPLKGGHDSQVRPMAALIEVKFWGASCDLSAAPTLARGTRRTGAQFKSVFDWIDAVNYRLAVGRPRRLDGRTFSQNYNACRVLTETRNQNRLNAGSQISPSSYRAQQSWHPSRKTPGRTISS